MIEQVPRQDALRRCKQPVGLLLLPRHAPSSASAAGNSHHDCHTLQDTLYKTLQHSKNGQSLQQTHPMAANTPDILGFFPQKSPLLLQRKPIHPSIYSFHECSPVDTYIRMFILAHVHSRTCHVLRILCTFVRTRKHLHIHTHAHTRSIY